MKVIYICGNCGNAYSNESGVSCNCDDCNTVLTETKITKFDWSQYAPEKKDAEKKNVMGYFEQRKQEKVAFDTIRQTKIQEFKENIVKDLPIYEIEGCRGRNIAVFENRVIITTDVTLGAILTKNATDGEKTIFYSDVVGLQYKKAGFTIGYLQLETASGQMNNASSNAFSENTFTFEKTTSEIEEMKEYIYWQISKRKK